MSNACVLCESGHFFKHDCLGLRSLGGPKTKLDPEGVVLSFMIRTLSSHRSSGFSSDKYNTVSRLMRSSFLFVGRRIRRKVKKRGGRRRRRMTDLVFRWCTLNDSLERAEPVRATLDQLIRSWDASKDLRLPGMMSHRLSYDLDLGFRNVMLDSDQVRLSDVHSMVWYSH